MSYPIERIQRSTKSEARELDADSVHNMLDEFFDQFSSIYTVQFVDAIEGISIIYDQIVQHVTEYVGVWNDNVRLMQEDDPFDTK